MRPIRSLALLTALVISFPAVGDAQEMIDSYVSTAAGLFQFDMVGNGLAPMAAVRAGMPVGGVLLLEGGVIAARPGQDFGTSTFIAPEAQLQLGLPFTGVVPYMALGAGAVLDFRGSDGGGTATDFSISGALGVRGWIGDQWGLAGEFRGRGIGADFEHTSAEYTLGALWRI